MKETLQCSFVGFFEVFEFEVVSIGGDLRIFPAIHDLISMLRVSRYWLPKHKTALRDVIIGGPIPAKLGFDKYAVASAIPRHIAFLMWFRH